MTLDALIISQIADLDTQIAFLQSKLTAEVASLAAKRAVLVSVQKLVTPDIEAAVGALQKLGFITLK